jgi:UrcA family protein
MLVPLLLGLAMGATSPADYEIVVVDDQPRITIPLDPADLGKAEGLHQVERKIHVAAIRVCDRGYRGVSYLETVACVKAAIAEGNAQLGRIQARGPGNTPVTAAIAVTAPSN